MTASVLSLLSRVLVWVWIVVCVSLSAGDLAIRRKRAAAWLSARLSREQRPSRNVYYHYHAAKFHWVPSRRVFSAPSAFVRFSKLEAILCGVRRVIDDVYSPSHRLFYFYFGIVKKPRLFFPLWESVKSSRITFWFLKAWFGKYELQITVCRTYVPNFHCVVPTKKRFSLFDIFFICRRECSVVLTGCFSFGCPRLRHIIIRISLYFLICLFEFWRAFSR